MNYACHADVVCQNYAISADFPGAATRKVEEAFGNNLNCLFVQGAAGDIESLIISSLPDWTRMTMPGRITAPSKGLAGCSPTRPSSSPDR